VFFARENPRYRSRPLSKMDRRIESGDDIPQDDRSGRTASSGLTMCQHCGASCADPEQLLSSASSSIQNHSADCRVAVRVR
jgi:hypothetical protein